MITQIHVEPADHDTDLCELLGKYGSDKGNATGTARHDYSRYYVALFRPIREQVTRVFELGIFQGASIRAWRDYFQGAIVSCADIDPGLVSALECEPSIVAWQCDETSEQQVAVMWSHLGMQDVIIDDALHTLADNLRFWQWSKHMLRSGGLYIIEDVPACDIEPAKLWAEQLRKEGWAAHLLVIPRVVNGEDVPDNNILCLEIAMSRVCPIALEEYRVNYRRINRERIRASNKEYYARVKVTPEYQVKVRQWRLNNLARRILNVSRAAGKRFGYAAIGHGMNTEDATAYIQTWLDRKPDVCEFCHRPRGLGLDHNHQTGRIRAWLCDRCNMVEGLIASGIADRLREFIAGRET